MDPLLIAGGLCYALALALPAYRSTGFFAIGGRGWKILFLSLVLMVLGGAAILKGEGEKSLFYFLPGALNIVVALLLILGLCSVRGPGVQLLGVFALGSLGLLLAAMLLRMREDLQVGTGFWCAACVLLALHGLRG